MGGIRTNGLFTTATKSLFPTSTPGHKDSPGRRYTTDIQAEGDQHGWQYMWCSICIFIICVPDYFFVRGREISICGGQIRQKRSRILPQQKHLHSNFFLPVRKNLNTIWKFRRSLGCCNSQVIAWLSVSPRWTWCQAAPRSLWAIKGRV